MSEGLFLGINSIVLMISFIVIKIVIFKCSKEDIYIGVRIPPKERNSQEIKKIGRGYINSNIYICVPLMIVLSFLVYKIESIYVFLICIFVFIGINFWIYYLYNRMVRKLKLEKGWLRGNKQIVTIDTIYSREKNKKILPSSLWFLVPIIILVINIILNFKYYANLPSKVATQWDFSGNVTCYKDKSIWLIFEMPKIQFFMIIVTFISFKGIGWAKQEISSNNSEESIKNNIVFRKVWGIYTICTCIIMTLVFTLGNFQIMNIINISPQISGIFTMSTVGIMIIIALVISIKIGQGGSKLSSNKNKGKNDYVERDDDKFWKCGNTFYYNPNDPSIFIEKRFGIGWTVNAGNKVGILIYVVLVLIIVISLVVPSIKK